MFKKTLITASICGKYTITRQEDFLIPEDIIINGELEGVSFYKQLNDPEPLFFEISINQLNNQIKLSSKAEIYLIKNELAARLIFEEDKNNNGMFKISLESVTTEVASIDQNLLNRTGDLEAYFDLFNCLFKNTDIVELTGEILTI